MRNSPVLKHTGRGCSNRAWRSPLKYVCKPLDGAAQLSHMPAIQGCVASIAIAAFIPFKEGAGNQNGRGIKKAHFYTSQGAHE